MPAASRAVEREVEDHERRDAEQDHRRHDLERAQLEGQILAEDRARGPHA